MNHLCVYTCVYISHTGCISCKQRWRGWASRSLHIHPLKPADPSWCPLTPSEACGPLLSCPWTMMSPYQAFLLPCILFLRRRSRLPELRCEWWSWSERGSHEVIGARSKWTSYSSSAASNQTWPLSRILKNKNSVNDKIDYNFKYFCPIYRACKPFPVRTTTLQFWLHLLLIQNWEEL